jgi:hypothetical protein
MREMQNNKTTYIAALFFLLTLLSVASPYLHQHEADFHEHENCVAYLLSTIFSIGIIAAFLFLTFTVSFAVYFRLCDKLLSHGDTFQQTPRAPPLSF